MIPCRSTFYYDDEEISGDRFKRSREFHEMSRPFVRFYFTILPNEIEV